MQDFDIPKSLTSAFDKMLQASQTKLIGPTIAFTLVCLYRESGQSLFTSQQIRARYNRAVCECRVRWLKFAFGSKI